MTLMRTVGSAISASWTVFITRELVASCGWVWLLSRWEMAVAISTAQLVKLLMLWGVGGSTMSDAFLHRLHQSPEERRYDDHNVELVKRTGNGCPCYTCIEYRRANSCCYYTWDKAVIERPLTRGSYKYVPPKK